MALIKCPECRGQVSDQATACPHCGHPTAALTARKRAALGVAMGLMIAGVLAGVLVNQKGTGGSTMPMVISIAVAILVLAVLAAITWRRRPV